MTEKCVVLSPSPPSLMSLARSSLGVAFFRSMLAASFLAYSLVVRCAGILTKSRIAEIVGAVAVGAAHGLDHEVQRFRRPAALFLQVEVFEDVEHLNQADAAGTGRRRAVDVVAAIGAVDRLARVRLDSAARSALVMRPPPAFISAAIRSAIGPL